MSEEVLIVVRAEDQATPTVRKANSAVKEAGSSARRAGEDASRGSSGWVTAGNATDKAGTKARDASGKFLKAGSAAAASGASASRGASGFTRLGASMDAAQRKTVGFGKAYREALDERTTGRIDLVGAALVGAFGAAAWAAANFDKELSSLRAVTGATGAEMESLRTSALQAGADTAFSASEAAIAQTELAKAGVTTADILGGALSGSLDLAAAGGVELGRAAEIAASSMNMFGLAGRDVGMIADTLASGANKSAAGVDDLAQALSMGGSVAANMGMSIQETTGVLSALADNALKGSDAGTAMKTMLMRLTPTSAEAAAAMEELNISAYDAQGNFIGVAAFAGQLQSAMGKLTVEEQEMAKATIFGTDAIRAANVLIKEGEQGILGYTAAMDDQGAAARMASTMMDNLAGDLEALKGSIETVLIDGGTGANDALRSLAKTGTRLVNTVGNLPAPIIQIGFGLTAVAGAALLVVPRVLAAAAAMRTLQAASAGGGPGLGRYAGAMKAIGTASAVAAVGLPIIGSMVKNIGDSMYGATTTAGQLTDTLVSLSTGADVKSIGQFGDGLDTLGKEIDGLMNPKVTTRVADFFGTLAGQGGDQRRQLVLSQIAELDTAITGLAAADGVPAAERAFAALAQKQGLSAEQTDELKRLMPQYADALALAAAEEKSAAAGADGLAGSLDDVDPSATGAEQAITGLTAAISRAQGFLAGRDAVRSYKAALDEFDASLKKNGETFNDNTAKGRANTAALDAIAQAATAAYTATDEAGNVTVANEKAYGRAAVTYYRNARALGMTAAEAANLTTQAFDAEAAATALAKVNAKPKIAADITTLEDQLATVNGRIMALGQKERTPEIDAKITKAMAKSKLIQDALDTLNGTAPKPEVTATTAAAEESIGRVQAALTELDGKRVTVYIDVHQNRPIPGSTPPEGTGDTASPKATGGNLARTLARHAQISAGMAGMRVTNLLVGGGGRGRGSGDHQAGRAIDVQGPRLGDYVRRVRESGGFAELHGTGGDRHAHAVMGDTASPRSGNTAGGDVNVSVPVQVIGRLNADEIEGLQQAITSAVGPAVSRWTQQRRERGK